MIIVYQHPSISFPCRH